MPTTGFYDTALDEYAKGNINPLTDTLRMYGLDSGYVVNLAAHEFLATVAGGDRIGFYTLANKVISGAAFDNTVDPQISNPLNLTCTAIIVVKWTGSDATSQLIFYDDDITPSTSDPINVALDAGGIWQLVG